MASSSSQTSSTALIQQLDAKSRDLIAKIVAHLKSQGNFDQLRRDCLEELDKMEAFRQLNQRVESYVATFLSKQEWSESLSKNQIRDSLRKHVCASEALKSGAQRLVSQVLEKKSKSFQTRLEGVVQNYIYMEKEKEKHSRYQNRSEPERVSKSFDNKSESEKASAAGKSSTISDIDDIISQIPGPKENTTKSEGSTHTKSDSRESLHPSTSTHHRTDSSLQKQQVVSSHYSKAEHGKFEKKGDSTSLVDTTKNTTSSKANVGAKKVNTNKRVIPKIAGSQNTGITSEKSEVSPRTKNLYNKPSHSPKSHSPKVESPRDNTDVEKPTTKPETVISSSKYDLHKTSSPPSHVSKGSHNSAEKVKHGEISSGLHSRQKLEDKYIESTKSVQENIKPVDLESKSEEKPSFETTKRELQERKIKGSSEKDQEESKVTESETGEEVSSSDDYNKDTPIKESLPQDSESDLESDVSDVSSVHTSDLSSFDGEVSSDSNHDEDAHSKKESKGRTSESEGKSEGKDKNSSGDGKSKLPKGRRKNLGTDKMSEGSRMQSSSAGTPDTTVKRKRGRPRKDRSISDGTQNEQYRNQKQQRSRLPQADKESSDDYMPVRDRSKRPIKKRRCYSPSTEGSREVCLPSKRSRVSSKD